MTESLKLGEAVVGWMSLDLGGPPGTGRTSQQTASSLWVLTGETEMRVTRVDEPSRITEWTRGRTCVNCGYAPFEYVPIPSRKDMTLLCVPCMEYLLTGREPLPQVVGAAIAGLQAILEDTDE